MFDKMKLYNDEQLSAGRELIEHIKVAGFDAYFVGGCVRDLLLGQEPKDVDIATNAPMDCLEFIFRRVFDVGQSKDFGIIVVPHKGFAFEIAQFRTEGEYSDGRRPDEVQVAQSFEEDVKRRDFTINALGLDVEGNVIDHVNGQEALEAGVIQTVGNPHDRFNEDHLRMLRAVRFAVRLGFDLDEKVADAIRVHAPKINEISVERVKDELFKMASLDGDKFADAIEMLDEVGLLLHVMPEVKAMQNVHETQRWHPEAYVFGEGRVFDHVMCAVRQNTEEDALFNFSVLFHDLGKTATHEWNEERQAHQFRGHDVVSEVLAGELANRLKFSNEEKAVVKFCAREHMKAMHLSEMKKSKVAKLVNHKFWKHLKNVIFCDDSSRMELFNPQEHLDMMQKAEKVASDVAQFVDEQHNSVEVVNGKVIMEMLDIKPSPLVGKIKKEVTERFLDADEFQCVRKLVKDVANELQVL
jgi:poly(A) polymerase